MAQRASPAAPDALDYFPTPPWAARAGGELIKRLDPAARTCWEPACGEGHMAWGLKDYFDVVGCSDIHAYGAGAVFDFLADDPPAELATPRWDWIVTNPPFVAGEAFVRAGLKRARRGVAMLLRSVFLEGAGRYPIFTDEAFGFAVHAQFAERVPMVKGRWDPQASSATAYSWFVWFKPELRGDFWIRTHLHGCHFGTIIPPGTRQRLLRTQDLARFCGGDGGELFSGA